MYLSIRSKQASAYANAARSAAGSLLRSDEEPNCVAD